jgi:hypothetical protein
VAAPIPKEDLTFLNGSPSLDELMLRFPAEWEAAGRELVAAMEDGRAEILVELSRKAKSELDLWKGKLRRSKGDAASIRAALPHLARGRMTLLALEKCFLAASTGKASGKIRFNLVNGLIVQKLLFSRHLTRKAASLGWFRFWWPLVWQKRFLMPLVQKRGIYCFYSDALIRELAELIGNRSCLEIAAGDGTLTGFLTGGGVRIRATDDRSWDHSIEYPESVEKLDARQALERYKPEAVVCSWPPPGNGFERFVFSSPGVQLYIVIGSRYAFASGNWKAYETQGAFQWENNKRLSRMVLPPELDSAVLVFRRNGPGPSHRV